MSHNQTRTTHLTLNHKEYVQMSNQTQTQIDPNIVMGLIASNAHSLADRDYLDKGSELDRPRYNNNLSVSNANINYCGFTKLYPLIIACMTLLKQHNIAMKAIDNDYRMIWLMPAIQTDKENIKMRLFSFNRLTTDGYLVGEIWRSPKLTNVKGHIGTYGNSASPQATAEAPEVSGYSLQLNAPKAEEPAPAPIETGPPAQGQVKLQVQPAAM